MTKLVIALMLLPALSWANTGFICPDLNKEISRSDNGELHSLMIKNTKTGEVQFNERLDLSSGVETSDYQERMGIYNLMMDHALLSFPYRPEFILVFHAIRAGSLYRKGFLALEGKGDAVKLNKMYCKAFIKSIMDY